MRERDGKRKWKQSRWFVVVVVFFSAMWNIFKRIGIKTKKLKKSSPHQKAIFSFEETLASKDWAPLRPTFVPFFPGPRKSSTSVNVRERRGAICRCLDVHARTCTLVPRETIKQGQSHSGLAFFAFQVGKRTKNDSWLLFLFILGRKQRIRQLALLYIVFLPRVFLITMGFLFFPRFRVTT